MRQSGLLSRLCKPWYVWTPTRLLRRALGAAQPAVAGYMPLRTSWGVTLQADAGKAIGRGIRTTGVHDLAASELLLRLVSPGDTVVDAGAHVGYMTLLAALAAGASGKVWSFEPHPELFRVARQNVAAAREQFHIAQIELRNAALGDTAGAAALEFPPGFDSNDGMARVAGAG